ncbi:unnamed protein product [Oikopleura dioica]|uniref:Uncharacterized protein n=1 Tax=Oikopleura dioica TaxID=34765 RepID=E4YF88_OIKDI|nr:unnamed protein product [Oikopleura dioica]
MPSKHDNFVREPIDEKEVCELPGVGKVAQNRLAELGFAKCYQLLGKYMGETEQKFETFLLEKAALSKKNAGACTKGIKEYLENEKQNFRERKGSSFDQPNVTQELIVGLEAQKLCEDSPEPEAAKKIQESSKAPLEILKTTFSEILEVMEEIPEGEQKTLLKMHNKENIHPDADVVNTISRSPSSEDVHQPKMPNSNKCAIQF